MTTKKLYIYIPCFSAFLSLYSTNENVEPSVSQPKFISKTDNTGIKKTFYHSKFYRGEEYHDISYTAFSNESTNNSENNYVIDEIELNLKDYATKLKSSSLKGFLYKIFDELQLILSLEGNISDHFNENKFMTTLKILQFTKKRYCNQLEENTESKNYTNITKDILIEINLKTKLVVKELNSNIESKDNDYNYNSAFKHITDTNYISDLNFLSTYYSDLHFMKFYFLPTSYLHKHFIKFYFTGSISKLDKKLTKTDLEDNQQKQIIQYAAYDIMYLDRFKDKTANLKLPNTSELENFYKFLTNKIERENSRERDIAIRYNSECFNYFNYITNSSYFDSETETLTSSDNSVNNFSDSISLDKTMSSTNFNFLNESKVNSYNIELDNTLMEINLNNEQKNTNSNCDNLCKEPLQICQLTAYDCQKYKSNQTLSNTTESEYSNIFLTDEQNQINNNSNINKKYAYNPYNLDNPIHIQN